LCFFSSGSPEDLVAYPYYILIHFFEHGIVFLWDVYLLAVYFSNSKSLRAAVYKEMVECWQRLTRSR
jgi:hypothetical protein